MYTPEAILRACEGGATVEEIARAAECPRMDVEQYLYVLRKLNRVVLKDGVYYRVQSDAA